MNIIIQIHIMYMQLLLLFITLTVIIPLGNAQRVKQITYKEKPRGTDSLEICEGILSQRAMRIKYKRNRKNIATITLSEPIMVAMADQEEGWGFFQFPYISEAPNGTLRIEWSMNEDSYVSYGKGPAKPYTPMISKDRGKTWIPQDKGYFTFNKGYSALLRDGSRISIITSPVTDVRQYSSFPKAVAIGTWKTFYLHEDLPDELKGVYLNHWDARFKYEKIHSKIVDPGVLRHSINNFMPISWWGELKELSDGSLLAGVYPTNYIEENGQISSSSVSFYKSNDKGNTWIRTGRIPVLNDGIMNVVGDSRFEEPTFEILRDSTLICVLRSGSYSPLYKTFSKDKGCTWSSPVPFTPNGVKPNLLLLKNGVLVLASGRPGIQLRFCFKGDGVQWSQPVDMIPIKKSNRDVNKDVSCGYVTLLEADEKSFYMVYSDFTTLNENKETRKSIWFRKITINLK